MTRAQIRVPPASSLRAIFQVCQHLNPKDKWHSPDFWQDNPSGPPQLLQTFHFDLLLKDTIRQVPAESWMELESDKRKALQDE
eukprot:2311371-Prymnesium_polylepis.1